MSAPFDQPRPLACGSEVVVCFTRNDLYPFQTSLRIYSVTLLHAPCDVGDAYHFRTLDGIDFTVNPSCSAFVGIVARDEVRAAIAASTPDTAAPCGCYNCWENAHAGELLTHMIACSYCGNKRCPKANWHGFKCTNSNDTGQVGTPDTAAAKEAPDA